MVTDEVGVSNDVLVLLRTHHKCFSLKKVNTWEKRGNNKHFSLLMYIELIKVNIEFCVLFRSYINISI